MISYLDLHPKVCNWLQINIAVVPVIGVIWDKTAFEPTLNAAEVECVYDAPLEMFLKVGSFIQSRLCFSVTTRV